MRKSFENKIPFTIILILGIIYVFLFYGKVLLSPNSFIFSDSGDGIKNYFTYAYHIKHDSTFTNMEGMNYPYGENYLYTDSHPVISNTLKYLSSVNPYFDTHSIGILNLILILSILISFIVIFFVLVELKFNRWFSIIFSFCITLLAPQLFRLEGHLALSYSFAIPLSWLLILVCSQKFKTHLFVLLFINNLFWMFIHAYLGIIIISFLFSFLLTKYFFDKHKRAQLWQYIWLGVAILLPIILFYIYNALIDTHIGRTNNPSGFFLYNAEIDDILIPSRKPFGPLLNSLTGGAIKLKWEAMGYIGMINSLFFIFLVLFSIISVFNKKALAILKSFFSNKLINISLVAAFIVFLFALGIPFKQLPNLLEIFPIFKQFRATGRFVWPFYFAFTVFAAYVFQEKILVRLYRGKGKIIGIIFMILYISGFGFEAFNYHKPISKNITNSPNLFRKEQLSEDTRKAIDYINPEDYQAIISIPFYYQGSESYSRPRQDEAVKNSLVFSYHTGIPNVCANLTRTSIEESKRIVQIVSPNYYNKKITNDIKSKKPFLIFKTGTNFTKYEEAILKKGNALLANDNFELLEVTYEELFSNDCIKLINDFQAELPNLIRQGSFYASGLSSFLYYNSFDEFKSDTTYRGNGSYASMKRDKNTFVEFPSNTFQKGKEYDLSVWMYNGVPDALNLWFRLIIEEYDEETDHWYSTTIFPDQAEVIDDNWSLVEGTFSVHDSKNRIYIVSKGKMNSKATLHVDDILIKEKGINLYKLNEVDSYLFFNNHKIFVR